MRRRSNIEYAVSPRRLVAALLALSLIFASFPLAISVPAPGAKTPCLSADICHPLQSLDRAADLVPIARPAARMRESVLTEYSAAPEYLFATLHDLIFTPDPPPPKAFAA
jgi:hypothetical protein